MAKIFSTVVKRFTTIISGVANLIWPETVNASDADKGSTALPESANAVDAESDTTALPEVANVSDAMVGSGTGSQAETVNSSDASAASSATPETVNVSEVASGTFAPLDTANASDAMGSQTATLPETVNSSDGVLLVISGVEPQGDNWTDQASTGTNHGTDATLISKGKSTLSSDERRAFMEWNLTGLTGFEADPNAASPRGRVTFRNTMSGSVLAVTLASDLQSNATQPFVEASQNWSNQADFTSRQTFSTNIPDTTPAFINLDLSDATVNAIIGQWVQLKIAQATAALPPTHTIDSREAATAANRPVLTLKLRRIP